MEDKDDFAIEEALRNSDKYQTLVKEKPVLTKKAKGISQEAKQHKLLESFLEKAMRCNLCGARVDKKAMQLGHTEDKKSGGLATTQNSEWQHPFCNSTYKPWLETHKGREGIEVRATFQARDA